MSPKNKITKLTRSKLRPIGIVVFILVFGIVGVNYLHQSHAISTLPGDLNGDGLVNNADFIILQGNFQKAGQTEEDGDLNNDGKVDIFDVSILLSNWSNGSAIAPDTFIQNGAVMANAKANISQPQYQTAIAALTQKGNANLNDKLLSVMDKNQTPANGDKHEYMSLAPYYWPNPNTANGLPYVYRDGQVNPESLTISDRVEFNTLVREVNFLTTAYYFTNQTKYSDKAAQMIRTWFLDPATKMNPNMQYAGAEKGISDSSFPAILQIYELPQILDAVQILKTSSSWTASDQTSFNAWCSSYFTWLTTSPNGVKEATEPNNHGSWYNADAGALAEFLGNHSYVQQAITKEKVLIDNQIRGSDGYQSLEMVRTKPWNYSTLNLAGLATLAQIAQHENIDLWDYTSPHGGSIKKAINFLEPYANTSKSWPYPDLENPISLGDMTIPLRQAATAYDNPTYSHDADMGLGTTISTDYSSLLY